MKEHRTINSEWESLVKAFFNDAPIPKVQHDEMQKAFYAGAATVINIMISFSDDRISEAVGAEIFEGMRQECIEFAKGLKNAK